MEKDNPNNIHALNQFEKEGHADQKYNHFRLTDLTREELYAMGVPAILDDENEWHFLWPFNEIMKNFSDKDLTHFNTLHQPYINKSCNKNN